MAEYTYTDVIINPEDPRVEIGAEYYCSLGAQACIDYANRDVKERTLDGIDTSGNYSPFIADGKDYPFIIRKKESSYAERQEKWIAANDLKEGDKVRIIRKADSYEAGWSDSWVKDMDEAVGKVYTVRTIYENEISLEDKKGFGYPYFVLEKVEQKYVPFDLSKEEDRAKLRGAWVRKKEAPFLEQEIAGLSTNVQLVFLNDVVSVGVFNLLEEYEFTDGTPCGKLVEG